MPISRLTPAYSVTEDRLAQLKQVIPEAFADGKINWEVLREVLGEYLEDEDQAAERFGLFWPGKREARRAASTPPQGALRPAPGEGVNEDTTRHVFIEGENLEVLRLLRKAYAGRVKMIYIDPPYNTGNDFVYSDDYAEPAEAYLRRTGQAGERGEFLTTNPKTSGRFHSNWLNMMWPRLATARQLLPEDGVIFVSMDDHEVHSLRSLMDEVFGEENFLANLSWRTDGNFDNQAKFKRCHEYILVYAKNADQFPSPPVVDPTIPQGSKIFLEEIRNTIVKNGPKNPVSAVELPQGFPADLQEGTIGPRSDCWPHYLSKARIEHARLTAPVLVESGWSSKDQLMQYIAAGCAPIVDAKGQETRFVVSVTGAIEAIKTRSKRRSHVVTSLSGFGGPQKATAELEQLGVPFAGYPKPPSLIRFFLQMNEGDSYVSLDFFAGSCTTAQAVMELNRQDGGSRRFIMVQFPEPTGVPQFPSIADIGKERIRRVIARMQQERLDKLNMQQRERPEDLGFRVYKLGLPELRRWQPREGETTQDVQARFAAFESPLVDGWDPDALRVEVMLQEGFPLDSRVERLAEVTGNSVDCITSDWCEHHLFLCLDAALAEETVERLPALMGAQDILVCLDSALTDESKMRLDDRCNVHVI